jgi:hypothetical protein
MLKIRKEQSEAFQKEAADDFEARAIKHIRRDLAKPASALTDDDIRRRVRECIPRAKEYGLITEKQIICFVDVSILLGDRFDTDPKMAWSGELLRSKNVSVPDKTNLLLATACSVYKELKPGA